MLADGDERAIPVALRTVADAVGGMTALAERTGLSRETLSERGNLRLDTLAAILATFGLRTGSAGMAASIEPHRRHSPASRPAPADSAADIKALTRTCMVSGAQDRQDGGGG